jgi:hypothetical protein
MEVKASGSIIPKLIYSAFLYLFCLLYLVAVLLCTSYFGGLLSVVPLPFILVAVGAAVHERFK